MKIHPVEIPEFNSLEDVAKYINENEMNIAPSLRIQLLEDSHKDSTKGYVTLAQTGQHVSEILDNIQTWNQSPYSTYLGTEIGKLRYDAMICVMKLLHLPDEAIQGVEKM